jgi:DNA-binding response OmpR family regulator
MRVLIVEDHPDLAANLGDYLAARGHIVDFAADGPAALRLAGSAEFDVIILDRMLPVLDGTTVCQRLRTSGLSTPILMLTALDAISERVDGLASGADDYLIKPFAMAELEARISALHRRAHGAVSSGVLRVADLEYNPQTCAANRGGQAVQLNPSTRRILEYLMRNHQRVVSRRELENLLWGEDVPDGDVLRAHIHVLRTAVDRDAEHKLLHTVRGAGYRLALINASP